MNKREDVPITLMLISNWISKCKCDACAREKVKEIDA